MLGRRVRVALIVVALLPPALAGCAGEVPEPVLFGCALSLSGKLEETGSLYLEGYELWKESVNSGGGISIGGESYQVDILYYDDESDTQQTGELVEKLITEDGVDFLLGPYGSSANLEAAAVADEYGVPMVQGGGAAEAIFTSGFEYVFGLLNPASDYFNSILEWGAGIEPGPNTVAIVSADDVFSLSAAEGAEQYAGELGYDVISLATFEQEGDLPGILGNLTDDDPDMVLFSAHFEEALSFVQAAKDVGLSPDMFGITVAPSDPAFVDELGADADYVFGTSQWLPVLSYNGSVFESAEDYALLYQQEYGREPDYHSAAASACGVSYQLALEEAGSLDRDDVRDALGALDAETFYGRINFGADGRIANCPMVALQIQGGNIVIIFPESLATGSALYPIPGGGTL